MQVILYTTHCPQCHVLEQKLKQKNITYKEIDDIEVMKEKGFLSSPMLEVDGVNMSFKTAYQYINSL